MTSNDWILRKGKFLIVKSKGPMKKAFANINDGKEITSIVEEKLVEKRKIIKLEKSYGLITFKGFLPFNLIGFIAKASAALASKKIPIFVISSYSTDHILVENSHCMKALEVLKNLK